MSERRSPSRSRFPAVRFLVFLMLVLVIACAGCTETREEIPQKTGNTSLTITDTAGNTIELAHPAERIICISNGALELLVILGAGEKIVGVTNWQHTNDTLVNNYLPLAEPVGSFQNPNIEKIVALKPDVIILYANSRPGNLEQIRKTGIPVLLIDGYMPSEIDNDTWRLARLSGTEANATAYVEFNDHYFSLIRSRLANATVTTPSVYLESLTDYMIQGNNTGGNEMITSLHARNLAGNISGTLQVSKEWVLQNNPDIIVKSSMETNLSKAYLALVERPGYSRIKAAQDNRVYVYYAPATSRPRYILTYIFLAKAFYPDLFTDLDPEQIVDEYTQKFLPLSTPAKLFYPE